MYAALSLSLSKPYSSLLLQLNSGVVVFFVSSSAPSSCKRRITTAMSGNPNFQRGRRGGGRGGGGRGRGSGGRGEQRWWDPEWRAQRLGHLRAQVEKVDQNAWWEMMEKLKLSGEKELIAKRNYDHEGQQTLGQMAQELGLYFHAYNKGNTLVVSKVPLPNYRADLDERHGSTVKEINMSNETKHIVGKLLASSKDTIDSGESSSMSSQKITQVVSSMTTVKQIDPAVEISKGKANLELKERQQKMKDSPSLNAIMAFRKKLPAFQMRTAFLKAVAENQVLVVSGETGCGKTTQLPQFILENEIECLRGTDSNIICTQPRRISAVSVSARIASEKGEALGETIGYQIRLESKRSEQTRLLFCTTGVLLRRLVQDPELAGVSHLFVDEIHERGLNEDFLIIILRDLLPRRPDLRLIVMSATINAENFSKYFGNAPTIHIPGFTFPVEEMFLEDVLERTCYIIRSDSDNFNTGRRRRRQPESKKDPLVELFEDADIDVHYRSYSQSTRHSLESWSGTQLDLGLVESTIQYICRTAGDGAILVFLTGWDEISKLLEKIKANEFLGNASKFLVLPLHGSMPTIHQREIFERPPSGKRKIILATNIAESSITIDDVVYVIDCGKAKETSYDSLNKLACLLPSWISKASAHQRRGRAGRVQPGFCYRLYPKMIHDAMPEYQLPEILRTPLQELCLHIKSLQLGQITSFLSKALQPPDSLSVQNAIDLLKTIGALDDMEELTSLGRHLCTLPLDPNIGKMLLISCIFQCFDPALTIAAALTYRDPFVLPVNRKEEADQARRSFAGDSFSDHIALLNAFEDWRCAKSRGMEREFCWDNYLSPITLQLMEDMRNQFRDLLSDIGFIDKAQGMKAYNRYSSDHDMLSAILCAGLYPNVIQCKRRGKRTAFFSKDVGKVDIHPSSVNAGVRLFPLPYMVYSEKVKTTGIYVRDSTNISDYALLMFGGSLTPSQNGNGIEMLDGYLHFSASKSTLQLIQRLRGELDKLLQRKIEEPELDISVQGKGVVDAVVVLLHSKDVLDTSNYRSR